MELVFTKIRIMCNRYMKKTWHSKKKYKKLISHDKIKKIKYVWKLTLNDNTYLNQSRKCNKWCKGRETYFNIAL